MEDVWPTPTSTDIGKLCLFLFCFFCFLFFAADNFKVEVESCGEIIISKVVNYQHFELLFGPGPMEAWQTQNIGI